MIHQALARAAAGEPITAEVLALRRALPPARAGGVFSLHPPDPGVPGVRPLQELATRRPATGDVLLVHLAGAEPGLVYLVRHAATPVVLRYHGIWAGRTGDARLALLLAEDRRRLADAVLSGRVRLAVATSRHGEELLLGLGYRSTAVVPPVLELKRLLGIRPRWSAVAPPAGGPVLIQVAPLKPGRGQEKLIQSFHVLKTYHRTDAELYLVGSPGDGRHRLRLEAYADELRLPGVHFTGRVHLPQLAAIYRRGDVVVSLSEQEGFAIPLVEAMAFGVPVVARAAAGIPETVGRAALLLDEPGPATVAEAVRRVLEDSTLRQRLAVAGRERAAALAPEATGRRLLDWVRESAA